MLCHPAQKSANINVANALTLMGDFLDGKEHFDRALAIYDPAEHRPLYDAFWSGCRGDPAVGSFGVSVATRLSYGFAQ
jgi:hypothetical protein